MHNLNRRRFLQVATAAGLAPALPAVSAGAATGTGAASHSQLLWASLHARAGSPQAFAKVATSMGLSQRAATGVGANLVQTRILTTHGATRLGKLSRRPIRGPSAGPQTDPGQGSLRRRLDRFLNDTLGEPPALDDADEVETQDTAPATGQSDSETG